MSKLDIFRNPKFWAIHLGSPHHHIAPPDYNELILVNNCKTKFCSFSYNHNSKALWQKKVLPKQSMLGWFKGILPLSSSVKYYYKLHFQTAGISSLWLQMLRYFTNTQIGIQIATTKNFRQLSLLEWCFLWSQTWLHRRCWLFKIWTQIQFLVIF